MAIRVMSKQASWIGRAHRPHKLVAEELDVPMSDVAVIQGDTALRPDQGTTSGSLSIQNGGMQLRQAAATSAAGRGYGCGVNIATPAIRNGVVDAADGSCQSASSSPIGRCP